MVGRLFILVAIMVLGPLYIEVYLYHPTIVMEHDSIAIIPGVASALALGTGFLLLALDSRITAAIFALACAIAIAVGVVGTGIHLAMHAATLSQLATMPNAWLGGPPVLVPLSFAAGGCLGLIPIALRRGQTAPSPPAISRILEAIAALCGLVATIAAAQVGQGAVALIAVLTGLGFGSFGFVAEIVVLVYPIIRDSAASRPS